MFSKRTKRERERERERGKKKCKWAPGFPSDRFIKPISPSPPTSALGLIFPRPIYIRRRPFALSEEEKEQMYREKTIKDVSIIRKSSLLSLLKRFALMLGLSCCSCIDSRVHTHRSHKEEEENLSHDAHIIAPLRIYAPNSLSLCRRCCADFKGFFVCSIM